MNDTSKPKRVLFKLSDVETQDIMYLKFLLDRQFLRAKFFLSSDLMKICQWIVKTIITTHNEDKTTQWYISKISRNYDKDLNYVGTNVNNIDFYLYTKIH